MTAGTSALDPMDRQAIADQLARYCRAMDRCDHALGYSVFHPDSVADYGVMFQGTGNGFVDFALESHKAMLTHQHQIGNMLIEIEGDAAASETYVTMMCRMPNAEGVLHDLRSLGRYVDRWEKRSGAWRIAERHYVHEYDDSWPVHGVSYPTDGRRDPSDVSYRIFSTIRAKEQAT